MKRTIEIELRDFEDLTEKEKAFVVKNYCKENFVNEKYAVEVLSEMCFSTENLSSWIISI
jgi:DNA integrity scanning protein DisA with diadenylate cyclase activity